MANWVFASNHSRGGIFRGLAQDKKQELRRGVIGRKMTSRALGGVILR